MSSIQMVELIKYHVEHGVPVALVNIRYGDGSLRYEWLVIGRANTSPSPIIIQLIDSKTGLDPILPRNARSHPFVKEIYQEIKMNGGEIDLRKKSKDFQRLVNTSQKNFQNLRFYKRVQKYIDVEDYWNNLAKEANNLGLYKFQKMDFKDYYKQWKAMVVNNYKKRLIKFKNTLKKKNKLT